MKVSIVGIVGVPASYGGFETLVENLLLEGLGHKHDITVYCSKKHYKDQAKEFHGANLAYINLEPNGTSSILYDAVSLFKSLASGSSHILLLGVSGAIVLPIVKLLSPKTKVITNIDGLEWRRDKWPSLAKKYLKFSESLAIKYSDKIIADNKAIHDYVLSEYNQASDVIAYGGDHAVRNPPADASSPVDFDYAFSVCRVEPENNIALVLEAFSISKKNIVFIGNWDASTYGKDLKLKYSNDSYVHIFDPIYDLKLLYRYRSNASAYVHGHSAGGTNPSLVEMMHFDVPILAYDCIYNRETLNNAGDFFTDVSSLQEILSSGFFNSVANVERNKEYAVTEYTWSNIYAKYLSSIENV
tara:strand:- start:1318 stop:2388 length:1071 start_codon:yes stop_codon:yes gene_type:complete